MAQRLEDRNLAEGGDGDAVTTVGIEYTDLLEGDDPGGLVVVCTVDYTVSWGGGLA